jgi:hypothetical protein
MSTASGELQLTHVITRLQQSYPELSQAEIHDIVVAARHSLAGARLHQFVPLLIEKSANAACHERCTNRRQAQRADAAMRPNDNDPGTSAAPIHSDAMTAHRPYEGIARRLRRRLVHRVGDSK